MLRGVCDGEVLLTEDMKIKDCCQQLVACGTGLLFLISFWSYETRKILKPARRIQFGVLFWIDFVPTVARKIQNA